MMSCGTLELIIRAERMWLWRIRQQKIPGNKKSILAGKPAAWQAGRPGRQGSPGEHAMEKWENAWNEM